MVDLMKYLMSSQFSFRNKAVKNNNSSTDKLKTKKNGSKNYGRVKAN